MQDDIDDNLQASISSHWLFFTHFKYIAVAAFQLLKTYDPGTLALFIIQKSRIRAMPVYFDQIHDQSTGLNLFGHKHHWFRLIFATVGVSEREWFWIRLIIY